MESIKIETTKQKCYFCEDEKNMRLPKIGIALSQAGNDYTFCKKCLTGMTADKFWKKFFKSLGYQYPPKLIKYR